MHDFIVNYEGELSEGARKVPAIREHVEGMPETASTFTLADVDGLEQSGDVRPVHVELAGSWPLHEVHDSASGGRRQRYVNPDYVHAAARSDLVVECGCGALLTRTYNDGNYAILDEDNHRDGCMVWDRHRARGDMAERRHDEMLRLTRIGWRGPRIAARFGISDTDVGSLAQQFGISLRERRRVYKREVAETYIEVLGVESGADVAEVYGHGPATVSRWASQYREDGEGAIPEGPGGARTAGD